MDKGRPKMIADWFVDANNRFTLQWMCV